MVFGDRQRAYFFGDPGFDRLHDRDGFAFRLRSQFFRSQTERRAEGVKLRTAKILLVIFERVDDLKPWGMLLSDDITSNQPGKIYSRVTRMRKKPPLKS